MIQLVLIFILYTYNLPSIETGDGGAVAVIQLGTGEITAVGDPDAWVCDAFFAPDDQAVISCSQTSMAYILLRGNNTEGGDVNLLDQGVITAKIDPSGERFVAVTMLGQYYNCQLKSSVIGLLNGSVNDVLEIFDPGCGSKKSLCDWTPCGRFVVLTSKICENNFGCPLVSLFNAFNGQCITRFCSPYPSNFQYICCSPVFNSISDSIRIAVADEVGRIFVLKLVIPV